MITNEQIKKIIDDCKKQGHTVSVRDISYILLCNMFDDQLVAYKCLFGSDSDYNSDYLQTYDQTDSICYLRSYIEYYHEKNQSKSEYDISFEENKAYMLKLKDATEKAIEKKEIPKKDGLKILADLSVKLNDKFNITDTSSEQSIVVENKFNTICDKTHSECWLQTKEFAMKHWNLVERDKK